MRVVPWQHRAASEVERAAVVATLRAALAHKQPPERLTAVRAGARLTEWLALPRTAVLLARVPGSEPAGLAVVRAEPPVLRLVFLGARQPRRGVGTALLQAVRELARRRPELTELRVALEPDDPAQRGFFLERHGFVLDDLAAAALAPPGAPHETVLPLVPGPGAAGPPLS